MLVVALKANPAAKLTISGYHSAAGDARREPGTGQAACLRGARRAEGAPASPTTGWCWRSRVAEANLAGEDPTGAPRRSDGEVTPQPRAGWCQAQPRRASRNNAGTSALEQPLTDSLGERLKSATKGLHHEVERGPFMRALLRGSLSAQAYCALLRNLHDDLRRARSRRSPHARASGPEAGCTVAALARREALAHDLDALHGPDWAGELQLLQAGRRYVQHLRAARPGQRPSCAGRARLRALPGRPERRPDAAPHRREQLAAVGRPARPSTTSARRPTWPRLKQRFRAGLDERGRRARATTCRRWSTKPHSRSSCTSCSTNWRSTARPGAGARRLERSAHRAEGAESAVQRGGALGRHLQFLAAAAPRARGVAVGDVHRRQAGVGEDRADQVVGLAPARACARAS